jgi:uncharacterized protein (TIGR03546 family)
MLIVKFLLNLFNVLNKNGAPRQIAGGMALGAIAGLTPAASLHNAVVLLLVLFLNVNISAALFAWSVFSAVGYLLDPLFNAVGEALLVKATFLKGFWTLLYNTPVVPWTKFNNTLTLGSVVVALVLAFPLFFLFQRGVEKYRLDWKPRIVTWRVVQALKASKLAAWAAQWR